MFPDSLKSLWDSSVGRFQKFIYDDVLHADESPRKLALGIAIGIFVALTPTIGLQMVIAGFFSWLLRANRLVSVGLVWISNPATMLPIYWYCYRVGCAFMTLDPIGREWWLELTTPPEGWWPSVQFYWSRLLTIATPLWLGAIIVGVVFGYVSYYLSLVAISYYRRVRSRVGKSRLDTNEQVCDHQSVS